MNTLSKAELEKLVNDEVKKVLKKELSNHIQAALKSRGAKEEVNNIIKDALSSFVYSLWTKKNVWKGDIK
jgi:flagellar basal body-associated protein FliL